MLFVYFISYCSRYVQNKLISKFSVYSNIAFVDVTLPGFKRRMNMARGYNWVTISWMSKASYFCGTHRYSFRKLMFKFPVGCNFMVARYAEKHELYFSIECCIVISNAQASEIQKYKHLLILQNLDSFCSSKSLWDEVNMSVEKSIGPTSDQRIREYSFKWYELHLLVAKPPWNNFTNVYDTS